VRFLLLPGNNSLSHVAKCLAVAEVLARRGHETLLAAGKRNARFVLDRGVDCRVLPDIQEEDGAGFPTVEWFRKPKRFAEVVAAETDLLRDYRPDRALGVFRFTGRASAELAGVPYDSLTCGCMLPESTEVLGFGPGDEGIEAQRSYLDSFYRFAGRRVSIALRELGLSPVADIREMLRGDRTFLWDFPEFAPLPPGSGAEHVGPVFWEDWPHDAIDLDGLAGAAGPLAVVTFGTCVTSVGAARRIVRILLDLGFRVLLAAGGQDELLSVMADDPRVTACRFAPLHRLFPMASLAVCHGGQMTLFEALSHGTPALVLPFQPEQAHNALCLGRLGCGIRLGEARPFRGNPAVYMDAFDRMDDDTVREAVARLTRDPDAKAKLAASRAAVARYDGAASVASRLEER
jgi:UDP:flavonoid glycosyltransferase YjiC (YdhE family)